MLRASDVVISPCSKADLAVVEALWPRSGCMDRYRRHRGGDSLFLLARSSEGVVGRAEIMWTGPRMVGVAEEYPEVPEINGLAVLPQLRRLGIGTALLLAAEDAARARRCRAIGLGVGVQNAEAERIYRRLGYVGELAYIDTYVLADEDGRQHNAADSCRFLTKLLY